MKNSLKDFEILADLIENTIKAARDMEDAAFMRADVRRSLGIGTHREALDAFTDAAGEMWKKFMEMKYRTI